MLDLLSELISEWKLNVTVMFRGGIFGNGLELDKMTREESPC